MLTLWILQAAVSYAIALFPAGADPDLVSPVAIMATVQPADLNCGILTPADGKTLRLTGTWYDDPAGRLCETAPIPLSGVPACAVEPCPVYQVFVQGTAVGDGKITFGTTLGPWGAAAVPMLTTLLPPPPLRPECLPPLGKMAVAIFPTGFRRTTGLPNSRSVANFQLASPNSPITALRFRIDGNLAAEQLGDQLLDTAGLWFEMPASGVHTTSLQAVNAYGCSREVAGPGLTVP